MWGEDRRGGCSKEADMGCPVRRLDSKGRRTNKHRLTRSKEGVGKGTRSALLFIFIFTKVERQEGKRLSQTQIPFVTDILADARQS